MIDFRTSPENYKHWKINYDGAIAWLKMDVDETATLFSGYELKQNSYDLGVDIELYDVVQRMRFEHPEVKTVVLTSGKDGIFCAGANIRMLGGAAHSHKVNFCKFTNETRNSIEDASEFSGQRYLSALNGTAAGGGYEVALATDYLMLIDDGNAAVSLPEVPLLAVLPGTGGLTRVTDKRKVRRDRSDIFCTIEEGISGKKAVEWDLVDECVLSSKFDERVSEQAKTMTETSDRPADGKGFELAAIERTIDGDTISYANLTVELNRGLNTATFMIKGPSAAAPSSVDDIYKAGAGYWPFALVRELDDAILHLRANEIEMGIWIFESDGDLELVAAHDEALNKLGGHWLVREISLYWKRSLKRLDVSSRSLFGFIKHGSCFAGFLAEIIFATDQVYMAEGEFDDDDRPAPSIMLTASNFGPYPMPNDITRLEARFYGNPDKLKFAKGLIGVSLDSDGAEEGELITFAYDDIDWDDEIRILLEERKSFSPDALTGMEANLRFVGPETMESKIFSRLTAWQNWIFQRPNAVGEDGALKNYGTGERPKFDFERV